MSLSRLSVPVVHFLALSGRRTSCGVDPAIYRKGPGLVTAGQWQLVTCSNCRRTSVAPGSQVSRSMVMPSVAL